MKIRHTLSRGLRWLASRRGERALVLLYHRIADDKHDPFGLSVAPANFAEQMSYIARHFQPVTIRELLAAARDGRRLRRLVSVTFDDGYSDNLTRALPVLVSERIPATIFVASGCLASEFWWDELARIVFTAREIRGDHHVPRFGSLLRSRAAANRRTLFVELHRMLLELDEAARTDAMDALRESARGFASRAVHLALSAPELRSLASNSLITIGSHTRMHPVLSSLEPAGVEDELRGSKLALEQLCGSGIDLLSYPFGLMPHIGRAAPAVAARCGYAAAFTAHAGVVSRRSNPLLLNRLWVRNIHLPPFARMLRRWS